MVTRVGSDHSLIQLEISIGTSEVRDLAFKWNAAHLEGEIADLLRDKWAGLPAHTSFFSKLRTISRLYRQVSKAKAKDFKMLELDTKAKLETTTFNLHEDPYNICKQGGMNHLQGTMDNIETHKARGAAIRARV